MQAQQRLQMVGACPPRRSPTLSKTRTSSSSPSSKFDGRARWSHTLASSCLVRLTTVSRLRRPEVASARHPAPSPDPCTPRRAATRRRPAPVTTGGGAALTARGSRRRRPRTARAPPASAHAPDAPSPAPGRERQPTSARRRRRPASAATASHIVREPLQRRVQRGRRVRPTPSPCRGSHHAVSRRSRSGRGTAVTMPPCALQRWHPEADHPATLSFPSRRSSRLLGRIAATASTMCPCPSSVRVHAPDAPSHTLTLPSPLPLTTSSVAPLSGSASGDASRRAPRRSPASSSPTLRHSR